MSVDVPSGWPVDADAPPDGGLPALPAGLPPLRPAMVVSLTAPKRCTAAFGARPGEAHWLGGRFLPPDVARAHGLEGLLALYQGGDQVVQLA